MSYFFNAENPPSGTISSLSWSDSEKYLAASSWDGTVSMWDVELKDEEVKTSKKITVFHEEPVLTCKMGKGNYILSGGCDKKGMISSFSYNVGSSRIKSDIFAFHKKPIKSIFEDPRFGFFLTCSWDKTIFDLNLPERVYCSDYKKNLLLVGLGGKKGKLARIDVRQQNTILEINGFEHSSLDSPNKSIALFEDASGCVVGGHDGSVAVKYFNDREKSYEVEAHKEEANLYNINDISFHGLKDFVFSTVSNDGEFKFWNKKLKKREYSAKYNSLPISCGQFSNENFFAFGSSDDFSKGNNTTQKEKSKVIIVNIGSILSDIKSKEERYYQSYDSSDYDSDDDYY